MDTNKIYTKSEKGNRALREGRALSSQERLVLLYVNGKNPNELIIEKLSSRMNITEIIHCFERLEEGGLIVCTNKTFQSSTQSPSDNRHLDMETKHFIETEMTEYIGPMAKIICADIWKKTNELETAVQLLSSNLPDKESIEMFKLHVLQKRSK